jgi:hypothetical protein
MFDKVVQFLQSESENVLGYEQFVIDWHEDAVQEFVDYEAGPDAPDKEEMVRFLRYEIETILEIMRENADGYKFFEKLHELLA